MYKNLYQSSLHSWENERARDRSGQMRRQSQKCLVSTGGGFCCASPLIDYPDGAKSTRASFEVSGTSCAVGGTRLKVASALQRSI